jgi:hypothetical protein
MANKFVLIPYDIYQSLINCQTHAPAPQTVSVRIEEQADKDEDDNINLIQAKDRLKNIKEPKGQKGLAYNQELLRYRKFRKERAEKPIPVTLQTPYPEQQSQLQNPSSIIAAVSPKTYYNPTTTATTASAQVKNNQRRRKVVASTKNSVKEETTTTTNNHFFKPQSWKRF